MRFLLNLRQLNQPELLTTSEAYHISRFSITNLRVPTSLLGNIGEPLNSGIIEHNVDDGDEDIDANPGRLQHLCIDEEQYHPQSRSSPEQEISVIQLQGC